jgi:hypothetical protein
MFRVVPPPIIRSTYNCIYSIWHLSDRKLLPAVCAPDDGWRYHRKHIHQFPEINKLCNVASCWIYIRIYVYVLGNNKKISKYLCTRLGFVKNSQQNIVYIYCTLLTHLVHPRLVCLTSNLTRGEAEIRSPTCRMSTLVVIPFV